MGKQAQSYYVTYLKSHSLCVGEVGFGAAEPSVLTAMLCGSCPEKWDMPGQEGKARPGAL
jgi:hypothetical protein